MKHARNSDGEPYECQKEWPDNCFVQCGGGGVVFTEQTIEETLGDREKAIDAIEAVLDDTKTGKFYRTAFFEAFPRSPNTFIRGEGSSIEEAEQDAWDRYQQYQACEGHQWERRGYTNGAGFCKHCGMFGSRVFEEISGD